MTKTKNKNKTKTYQMLKTSKILKNSKKEPKNTMSSFQKRKSNREFLLIS